MEKKTKKDGKYIETCCPKCGGTKDSKFELCYLCHTEKKEAWDHNYYIVYGGRPSRMSMD